MRVRTLIACAALAGTIGSMAFVPAASAQDSIYVPLFTYRTGPFAGSGIPIANGKHDYLDMLNARDGGIGGVKLVVEECETGYDTKKGVECYEQVKDKKPVIVNPWSTGITLQLIPKASVDKIPVLSMAYGLSAAAVGDEFPWIFNPPMTYWDALSIIFKFITIDAEAPIYDQHLLIRKLFLESRERPWPEWNEEAIADWAMTMPHGREAGIGS